MNETPNTKAVALSLQARWFTGDCLKLASEITLVDERDYYMLKALEIPVKRAGVTETLTLRNDVARLIGVASLVRYDSTPHHSEGAPPDYYLIAYMGARGGGAGTALTRRIRIAGNATKRSIYLNPTAESFEFWVNRMGALFDPDNVGAGYYGWTFNKDM